MHQEIKKFWETQNIVSGPFGDRSSEYYVWYVRRERDPFAQIIAHEWKDNSKINYYFNNVIYTENEMLRIVKLKYFL